MATELEFEGKDIKEAVEKACFTLQVTEAELEYEVIRQESRRLFGIIGGKNARIRVKKKDPSGKELVQDLIKSAFGEELEKQEIQPADQPATDDFSPSAEGMVEKVKNRKPAGGAHRQRPENSDIEVEFETEKITAAALEILELMGLKECRVTAERRDNELRLDISGPEELELLTRRRGAVLDALQFLVNKMHGVKGGRILVDCNDFRSRHEEDISELALRLGAKAKRLRKPVTINSLNAHDRRLVHLALQDDQELRSRSKGEGEFKKIVIYPANSQRRRSRSRSSAAEAV
jgi:spoIIIJ-associated protein